MKIEALLSAIMILGLVALTQASLAKDVPAELKGDATSIKDLVKDSSAYEGKDVVIQGKIQTECPAGCWFIVDDGVASIYVDILPSNFVIPRRRDPMSGFLGQSLEKMEIR